jgi:hypothetical protein
MSRGQKFSYSNELLTALGLRTNTIYTHSFIVEEVLKKCRQFENTNKYYVPIALHNVLSKYNRSGNNDIPTNKSRINSYVTGHKLTAVSDYVNLSDVLSNIPVRQLVVIV